MNKDKEYVKIFWYDCHFINCDEKCTFTLSISL